MNRLISMLIILLLAGCNQPVDNNAEAELSPADMSRAAAPASRSDSIGTHVFQFGIYKPIRKGILKTSPGTNTGKIIRKPKLEHVSMTDRIPLVKDTYFGYQFRLFNLPPEAMIKPVMTLRKVLIHPEMTLPDGTKTTGWDRPFKGRVEVQQVMGFDGYAFNEDYELVEGEWIFQLWYNDRKLIERKFTSVRPDQEKVAGLTGQE